MSKEKVGKKFIRNNEVWECTSYCESPSYTYETESGELINCAEDSPVDNEFKVINKNNLRQAITVTPKELSDLAYLLVKEAVELNIQLEVPKSEDMNHRKFSVAIINKTPECSDTWEFEK